MDIEYILNWYLYQIVDRPFLPVAGKMRLEGGDKELTAEV